MSDEDFYSEESYEFEFEDGDEDDNDVPVSDMDEDYAVENKYYSAKGLKYDDPDQAVQGLELIVSLAKNDDPEAREWVFKSCKQIMKIQFDQGVYDKVLNSVDLILDIGTKLPPNYFEELLSKMITKYTSDENTPVEFVNAFIDKILAFVIAENCFTRIWFKANLTKLDRIDPGDPDAWKPMVKLINERLDSIPDGSSTSYALQLMAAEVELYSQQANVDLSVLSDLYQRSLTINTAVAHPKIIGVLREAGARVLFYRGNFEKARLLFYECFNNYDEVGSTKKRTVLKYLALSAMLSDNEFNPFESQETQAYSQLDEYSGLMAMIDAYDSADIETYKRVVSNMAKENDPLASDPIFQFANSRILDNLIAKTLINLTKTYKLVLYETVCARCHLSNDRLQELVLELVTAGKLTNTKLDFVNRSLITEDSPALIFEPTSNGKSIYGNLQVINLFDLSSLLPPRVNGGTSTITEPDSANSEPSTTSVTSLIYSGHERPQSKSEWVVAADQWCLHLRSALPVPIKYEMSQKDKVISIQKQELKGDTPETGSALIQPQEEENDNQTMLVDKVTKSDMLLRWADEINAKLAQLSIP